VGFGAGFLVSGGVGEIAFFRSGIGFFAPVREDVEVVVLVEEEEEGDSFGFSGFLVGALEGGIAEGVGTLD